MRFSWWERLRAQLFPRRAVRYCSRCGRWLDDGQKRPRGVREFCMGTVDLAMPGEPPWIRCLGGMFYSQ